eukprot:gene2307-2615_t
MVERTMKTAIVKMRRSILHGNGLQLEVGTEQQQQQACQELPSVINASPTMALIVFRLDHIVNGEYYNGVTVVADEEGASGAVSTAVSARMVFLTADAAGLLPPQEIIVPDPADAARGLDPIAMRRWKLKKFSTVLIVSTAADPPYIGLIDKIWRDATAKPNPSTNQYETSDFHLEGLQRQELRGSRYQLPGERKVREERQSQRQVRGAESHQQGLLRAALVAVSQHRIWAIRVLQLSSDVEATSVKGDAQNGLLSLEGFLQKCKVHWLDLDSDPPERYFIHKGSLIRCREPGFVAQGFLWCNNKLQPQLHENDKRAYKLNDDWGDKATMKIVHRMKSHYEREARKLQERNQRVKEKYARLYQQKANGEISSIPSDDGEEPGKEQQQQQSS